MSRAKLRAPRLPLLVPAPALVLAALIAAALAFRPPAPPPQSTAEGGLVTLYAADDLASSLDLTTGGPGGRIVDGEIALDRAQLLYGVLERGLLSYGFGSDEVVEVVDLGPLEVTPQALPTDVSLKFPVSVFHTLALDGERLVFQDAGGSQVRLKGGSEIFRVPQRGLRHLEPVVGHIYVVRFQRLRGERYDRLAKFQVVDHRPGVSLTLRWAPLDGA